MLKTGLSKMWNWMRRLKKFFKQILCEILGLNDFIFLMWPKQPKKKNSGWQLNTETLVIFILKIKNTTKYI
jgi:hypothetical protein